jgi:hypothetical protein
MEFTWVSFIPLDILRCSLNRHVPVRSKVRWDGMNYVGHCRGCGQCIRRKERLQWRLDSLGEREDGSA